MEDGMRAAFDAIADGDETITFEELCTFVAKKTSLQAGPKELRPLFDFLDLDGNGNISADEFVWGIQHSSALKQIARAWVKRPFAVSGTYDYAAETRAHYAKEPEGGASPNECPDLLSVPFRPSRLTVDHTYHGVYSMVRQQWQDGVLTEVCSQGAGAVESPWCLFTAGGMGVGKGYVLRWLSDHGILPLDRIVHVDPDYFKSCLPEWDEYVKHDGETAGKLCHRESTYLAEVAQEASLLRARHMLVDGSLRDGDWYSQVFAKLRKRFPTLRIGILYVVADEETVRSRVAERAERTGRDVPEALWKASLSQVAASVSRLGALADVCATIDNPDGADPALTQLLVGGASSDGEGSVPAWESLGQRLDGVTDVDKWQDGTKRAYEDRQARLLRRFPTRAAEMQEKLKVRTLKFLGIEKMLAHHSHEHAPTTAPETITLNIAHDLADAKTDAGKSPCCWFPWRRRGTKSVEIGR